MSGALLAAYADVSLVVTGVSTRVYEKLLCYRRVASVHECGNGVEQQMSWFAELAGHILAILPLAKLRLRVEHPNRNRCID